MAIASLAGSSVRIIRSFARKLPPVRFPQPTRRTPKSTPFGLGILNPIAQWEDNGLAFTITEDTEAVERCGGYPYTLTVERDGATVETHRFDRESDARLYAYCVANPLPSEPTVDFPPAYPDECPESPIAAEHDPEDERWWAQHAHEEQDPFDAWLDSCAPDNYESMGLEGGGW
jgi:hypothetical protein